MGAEPTVLAATDPAAKRDDYAGPSRFFELRGTPKWGCAVNPAAKDVKLQDAVWQLCEKLSGCSFRFD